MSSQLNILPIEVPQNQLNSFQSGNMTTNLSFLGFFVVQFYSLGKYNLESPPSSILSLFPPTLGSLSLCKSLASLVRTNQTRLQGFTFSEVLFAKHFCWIVQSNYGEGRRQVHFANPMPVSYANNSLLRLKLIDAAIYYADDLRLVSSRPRPRPSATFIHSASTLTNWFVKFSLWNVLCQ